MIPGRRLMHFDRSIDTLAGAVDELRRRSAGFGRFGPAEVKIGSLMLPEFIRLNLVVLVGPLDAEGGWCIGLPSSDSFSARRAIAPTALEEYPIERLNCAIVDEEGNVTLADAEETRLFRVKLNPTKFSQSWTMVEERLLRLILKSMGVEMDIIYYPALPQLSAPQLKVIEGYIDDQRRLDPSIPPASRETIRQILLKVGMRRPRHGQHAV